MRPDRFERLLADAINTDGRLTAKTYEEAEFGRSPHGIIATTRAGVPVNVQIVGKLADGERHDHAEQPVTGDPHPDLDVPDPANGGKLDLAATERHLAGLVVRAAGTEIKGVALYQDRETPGAIRYGATFAFHNGAAVFLYILSAGASRHEDFVPPATVSV